MDFDKMDPFLARSALEEELMKRVEKVVNWHSTR